MAAVGRYPRPMTPLNGNYHDDDGFITYPNQTWTLWHVWLWWRQGRPRNFPIVLKPGMLAITVDERNAVVDILVEDFHLSTINCPGFISMGEISRGLLKRYGGTVHYPGGLSEVLPTIDVDDGPRRLMRKWY